MIQDVRITQRPKVELIVDEGKTPDKLQIIVHALALIHSPLSEREKEGLFLRCFFSLSSSTLFSLLFVSFFFPGFLFFQVISILLTNRPITSATPTSSQTKPVSLSSATPPSLL
jgi:hypothetical protein